MRKPVLTESHSLSMSSSSSSRCDPVPLEAPGTSPPSSTWSRRPRRVMYPASRSRRPRTREAADPAWRWLLLLSLLVFLQIYAEETHTCTELQNQCSEAAPCCPQEADGSLGEAIRCSGQESWRHRAADRAAEHQRQCVVA